MTWPEVLQANGMFTAGFSANIVIRLDGNGEWEHFHVDDVRAILEDAEGAPRRQRRGQRGLGPATQAEVTS